MNEMSMAELSKIIAAHREKIGGLEATLRLRQFEREKLESLITGIFDEIAKAECLVHTLENVMDSYEDKEIVKGLKQHARRTRK